MTRTLIDRHLKGIKKSMKGLLESNLLFFFVLFSVMSPTEQSGQLCLDFVNTCERRVVSRYKSLHNNTDHKYVSCE